jgi:beta-glucosidase
VNLYRVPQGGRNFEYLGEDPFLASRMVVPYIRACRTAA